MRELTQFKACLSTLVDLPQDIDRVLAPLDPDIRKWYREFSDDLYGSRAGYPRGPIRTAPDLEDQVLEICSKAGLPVSRKSRGAPALFLSHDVDYVRPTIQMQIKRSVALRRLSLAKPGDCYVESLTRLLDIDHSVTGIRGASTVFLAQPSPSARLLHRPMQWMVDPSYRAGSSEVSRLLERLESYCCEIGLHGSYFSIADGLLEQERNQLEKMVGQPITVGRQHWLNLPGRDPYSAIYESGLRIDSSLGWNGGIGFRGGMSRPFPIVVGNSCALYQVPLVLMDGPLFDDLKLSPDGALEMSLSILREVEERGGAVSINWHDRAAHPDFGWEGTYARILEWAKAAGFQFLKMSTAHPPVDRDLEGKPAQPKPVQDQPVQ